MFPLVRLGGGGNAIFDIIEKAFADVRKNLWNKDNFPIYLGISGAALLPLLLVFRVLENWSPMARSYLFDHFTLPRCGFAIRNQTDLFSSSQDYPHFGYHAIGWESQPTLCLLLGTPISFLKPGTTVIVATALYFSIHALLIFLFGRCLFAHHKPQLKDYLFFAFSGLFFPWYVMLVLGQYHAISVLACGLVLYGCTSENKGRIESFGFILSAISKPVLAPLSLLLLLQKKWKVFFTVFVACLFAYLPWLLFYFDAHQELKFGWNINYLNALERNASFANYTVPDWNQELGVAKVIDDLSLSHYSFPIRASLFFLVTLFSVYCVLKKRILAGYSAMIVWFFVYYSRGHEYHLTLYLPIFLALYCKSPEKYRNQSFIALLLYTALPTVFPFYTYFGLLEDPHAASLGEMHAAGSLLFYLYLFHKPLIPFLLLGYIGYKEFYSGAKKRGDMESARPFPV